MIFSAGARRDFSPVARLPAAGPNSTYSPNRGGLDFDSIIPPREQRLLRHFREIDVSDSKVVQALQDLNRVCRELDNPLLFNEGARAYIERAVAEAGDEPHLTITAFQGIVRIAGLRGASANALDRFNTLTAATRFWRAETTRSGCDEPISGANALARVCNDALYGAGSLRISRVDVLFAEAVLPEKDKTDFTKIFEVACGFLRFRNALQSTGASALDVADISLPMRESFSRVNAGHAIALNAVTDSIAQNCCSDDRCDIRTVLKDVMQAVSLLARSGRLSNLSGDDVAYILTSGEEEASSLKENLAIAQGNKKPAGAAEEAWNLADRVLGIGRGNFPGERLLLSAAFEKWRPASNEVPAHPIDDKAVLDDLFESIRIARLSGYRIIEAATRLCQNKQLPHDISEARGVFAAILTVAELCAESTEMERHGVGRVVEILLQTNHAGQQLIGYLAVVTRCLKAVPAEERMNVAAGLEAFLVKDPKVSLQTLERCADALAKHPRHGPAAFKPLIVPWYLKQKADVAVDVGMSVCSAAGLGLCGWFGYPEFAIGCLGMWAIYAAIRFPNVLRARKNFSKGWTSATAVVAAAGEHFDVAAGRLTEEQVELLMQPGKPSKEFVKSLFRSSDLNDLPRKRSRALAGAP